MSLRTAVVIECFVVCLTILMDREPASDWWIKKAVQSFFRLEELNLYRAHDFVAGPGVDTILLQRLGHDITDTDKRKELGMCRHGWTVCGEVTE